MQSVGKEANFKLGKIINLNIVYPMIMDFQFLVYRFEDKNRIDSKRVKGYHLKIRQITKYTFSQTNKKNYYYGDRKKKGISIILVYCLYEQQNIIFRNASINQDVSGKAK